MKVSEIFKDFEIVKRFSRNLLFKKRILDFEEISPEETLSLKGYFTFYLCTGFQSIILSLIQQRSATILFSKSCEFSKSCKRSVWNKRALMFFFCKSFIDILECNLYLKLKMTINKLFKTKHKKSIGYNPHWNFD